jgi:RIO kinase 1
MRFDDEERVDMVDPLFTRGELAKYEIKSILNTFDRVAEVRGSVNDGKEATVYLCADNNGDLLAAKVYRAQKFRAFSNAKQYVDTRKIRDKRARRAIQKGSRVGKQITHNLWVNREYSALKKMFEDGASVPQPLAMADFGILMEYIGDENGAAPMLVQMQLSKPEAEVAWQQCLNDVECLLDADLIHGDLSPYNVLWWQDRPRMIDLPQALDYRGIGNAFDLLHRDVANLASFFEKAGVVIDPISVVSDMAARYF